MPFLSSNKALSAVALSFCACTAIVFAKQARSKAQKQLFFTIIYSTFYLFVSQNYKIFSISCPLLCFFLYFCRTKLDKYEFLCS